MADSETKAKKVGLARLAKARSMSGGLNNVGSDSNTQENSSSDGSDIVLDFLVSPYIVNPPDVVESICPPVQMVNLASNLIPIVAPPDIVIHSPEVVLTPPSPDPSALNWSGSEHSPVLQGSASPEVNTTSYTETYIRRITKKEEVCATPPTFSDSGIEQQTPRDDAQQVNSSGSGTAPQSDDENTEVDGAAFSSPFKKSFLQSFHRRSFKKGKKNETSQLGVPQVAKRSRSLSRLSDAFTQVHNVCLLPAQPSAESEAKDRRGRRSTIFTLDKSNDGSSQEDSSEEFDSRSQESEEMFGDMPTRRWSSLGQINSDRSTPMSTVRPAEARQKNYLFGGLGSLLGPTELERYFPDRKVSIFIATWNMNGKEPPTSLDDFLLPDDMDSMPDMYVVGTQESGGDRMEWEVRLQTTIGPSHVLFSSTVLGILHLTVFIRRDLVWFCSVPEESYYSLRPGTYFKTKGAIAISFQFFGTKMLFVNTHLFAHEEKLSQRLQNYKNIIQNLDLPRNLRSSKKKSKDVTHRYDIVFWMGDLNFRLVGNREEILTKITRASNKEIDMQELMQYDQLLDSRKKGAIFNGFDEGAIHFAPTFKFDVGTNHYDSSSKQRVPSYTDRILYKSTRDPIKCTSYNSCPLFKTSDHKPVCGVYHFKVRPGKDDVPLAAGLFQRDVYLAALKRRRKFFHQSSSKNCQMQ